MIYCHQWCSSQGCEFSYFVHAIQIQQINTHLAAAQIVHSQADDSFAFVNTSDFSQSYMCMFKMFNGLMNLLNIKTKTDKKNVFALLTVINSIHSEDINLILF